MNRIRPVVQKSLSANARTLATQRPSINGHWMPFTDHQRFKEKPKIFTRAKGMYYYDENGREILDGHAGLWCVNAGHSHPKIVEAVQKQVAEMAYGPGFNLSHPGTVKFAQRVLDLLPGRNFSEVFFTMCGSSAVDSSLKIALQYFRSRGEGQRVRFIGRERAYHGVGFGGISVGGIMGNRKPYSAQMLPYTDHIASTHSHKDMAFSKGLPKWGGHLADELERLIQFHDPCTIAAVIMEPVAGSTGVLVPPEGYLKKIKEICQKHGILLIFDEVITGFGRVGASFAAEKFDVTPDMITCAKGLTNGAVPAGAVICQPHVFDTIYNAAHKGTSEMAIELAHGYTYSGHPLACAAGIATMDVYTQEGLFENADNLSGYFENAMHSLKGLPNITDIRNVGMMSAIEVAMIPGAPVKRTMDIFDRCFDAGVLVRGAGNTIAVAPPLICEKKHIDRIVEVLSTSIKESAKHLK